LRPFRCICHGFEDTPETCMMKAQPQVWRRHAACSALRPLDQADCIFVKVFRKARIIELLGRLEPIKIKVI